MMRGWKRFEAANAFSEMLLHDRSSEFVIHEVDRSRLYFIEKPAMFSFKIHIHLCKMFRCGPMQLAKFFLLQKNAMPNSPPP
jgi:hypothetical protein